MIGRGTGISSHAEFNRRARIAVRGFIKVSEFVEAMVTLIDEGRALTPNQQQAFINAIHSNRRQVSDSLVRDYAATHARGAD